jgi:hypothetical protein
MQTKDVPPMRAVHPSHARAATPIATRVCAALARAPGGASSLLRLSAAGGAGRLPSSAALGVWIGRAARSLARAA